MFNDHKISVLLVRQHKLRESDGVFGDQPGGATQDRAGGDPRLAKRNRGGKAR